MYWTDGEANKIFMANMDGTNKRPFVFDMTEPEGLCIDITEGR